MVTQVERRRANLVNILRELVWDGIDQEDEQAQILHTPWPTLKAVLNGASMTDAVARDIEWSAHKPAGWMDTNLAKEGSID